MKKTFLTCALALGVLLMPSVQADNNFYGSQYDPCCYAQDFSGLYVGGNIGVVSHTANRNDLSGFLGTVAGYTVTDTNFEAGVQLGFDWQWCNKLVGVVADWNWVDNERTTNMTPVGVTVAGGSLNTRHRWFTTIRARAGLTVADTLVYVTLGAAVSRFENNFSTGAVSFNTNRTRWGWTGGAGAEMMFWSNWSLGLEVLYLQYDNSQRSLTTAAGTFNFGLSDSVWAGRVLLNYRFGDLFGSWGI